jgi:hypothetical protein
LKNDSHVKRVFALLIIAGIMGFGIRRLLLPDTFGTIGHYQAESLKDILKLKRVYQSKDVYAPCHDDIYTIHEKDVHYYVKRSHMEDGKFPCYLKKQKPAGGALQVAISPGLMTGSSRLFTYPTKANLMNGVFHVAFV